MVAPLLVDDLVAEVRTKTDEQNIEVVETSDILAALNRAQRHAANITAKHYEELFIERVEFSSNAAINSVTDPKITDTGFYMPEDAYGDRIDHLLIRQNFYEYPLRREKYREIHRYTSSTQINIPSIYSIIGRREVIVKPRPTQGVEYVLYYTRAPESMVLQQGRITAIDDANNKYKLDAVGSDLSVSVDDLTAFFSVVDAQTGRVKASHQISAIDTATSQVTIKTATPDRTTLYGKTIATAIPTTGNFIPEVDDYLCFITGTSVCEFPNAYQDFFIQYATNEVKRTLGHDVQNERIVLDELKDEVERMWVGREHAQRIARRNKHWQR
jgi:hypothetical protein